MSEMMLILPEINLESAAMLWRFFPQLSSNSIVRVEFFGDYIERLSEVDPPSPEKSEHF